MMQSIVLPGHPYSMERPRVSRHALRDKREVVFRQAVRDAARIQMERDWPHGTREIYFPIRVPTLVSVTVTGHSDIHPILLAKVILDALQGLVIDDDRRVSRLSVIKSPGVPGVQVCVSTGDQVEIAFSVPGPASVYAQPRPIDVEQDGAWSERMQRLLLSVARKLKANLKPAPMGRHHVKMEFTGVKLGDIDNIGWFFLNALEEASIIGSCDVDTIDLLGVNGEPETTTISLTTIETPLLLPSVP